MRTLRLATPVALLTLSIAAAGCAPAGTGPAVPATSAAPLAGSSAAPTPAAPGASAAPATAAPSAMPSGQPTGGPSAAPTAGAAMLRGVASGFSGPLAGAQIAVYPASAAGTGTPLATATATAGADGAFAVALPAAAAGQPLAIIATSGSSSVATYVRPQAARAGYALTQAAPIELSPASLAVFVALSPRFKALAAMNPTPAEIEQACASFDAAVKKADAQVQKLGARAKENLLNSLGANGEGQIDAELAAALAAGGSDLARALEDAADALTAAIKERVKAGEKVPPGTKQGNFSFGGASGDPIRRSSGGGGSSEPTGFTINHVEATRLAVDPQDGTAWIYDGGTGEIRHLSASAAVLARFKAPDGTGEPIRLVPVPGTGSVWVYGPADTGDSSGGQALRRYYAPAGTTGSQEPVDEVDLGDEAPYAIDAATGDLWLGSAPGRSAFTFYDVAPSAPSAAASVVTVASGPGTYDAFSAAGPGTGGGPRAWIALADDPTSYVHPVQAQADGIGAATTIDGSAGRIVGTPDGGFWIVDRGSSPNHRRYDASGTETTPSDFSKIALYMGSDAFRFDTKNGDTWSLGGKGEYVCRVAGNAASLFAIPYPRPVASRRLLDLRSRRLDDLAVDSASHTAWVVDNETSKYSVLHLDGTHTDNAATPLSDSVIDRSPPADMAFKSVRIGAANRVVWVGYTTSTARDDY